MNYIFKSTADLTAHLSISTARLKGRTAATAPARMALNHTGERRLTESNEGKKQFRDLLDGRHCGVGGLVLW